MPAPKLKASEKALTRRYLVWCYKTTKESLDRIDRKFTQAAVDHFILGRLTKAKPPAAITDDYGKFIEDFRQYIAEKEKEGFKQKFSGEKSKSLHPEYLYLSNRLTAIEDAIRHFLGAAELSRIHALYEEEFTRRIIESKEH